MQARNPGMVEKRLANSGGRTDGIDGIDGTDETGGTDGTYGIDGRIATDPMQSLPPGRGVGVGYVSWLIWRTDKGP